MSRQVYSYMKKKIIIKKKPDTIILPIQALNNNNNNNISNGTRRTHVGRRLTATIVLYRPRNTKCVYRVA